MATKKAGWWGAVVSAAFSGVVAPVLVKVADRELGARPDAPAVKAATDDLVRVTVRGVGATPDEALHDALRRAVRSAAVDLGAADAVPPRCEDFVMRIDDHGLVREGAVCRKEVTVTVASRALAGALRPAHSAY